MRKPAKEKPVKPPLRLTPVAIQRLIDEVKADRTASTGYNRTYHRHNRS